MKVLVADDDAVSLLILCRAVEKSGHEYLAARDGSEAWRLYEDTPDVDAVISDWMMPEMDGLELCRSIRGQERDGYTYFIFLTALGGRDHLLEGFEAGADDYLTKPLDRAELEVRLISASSVTSLHRRLAEKNRQLESLNERLFEQSRKDPLTGLNNRLRLRELVLLRATPFPHYLLRMVHRLSNQVPDGSPYDQQPVQRRQFPIPRPTQHDLPLHRAALNRPQISAGAMPSPLYPLQRSRRALSSVLGTRVVV